MQTETDRERETRGREQSEKQETRETESMCACRVCLCVCVCKVAPVVPCMTDMADLAPPPPYLAMHPHFTRAHLHSCCERSLPSWTASHRQSKCRQATASSSTVGAEVGSVEFGVGGGETGQGRGGKLLD